jgi:cell wall assembly regulator SMI1
MSLSEFEHWLSERLPDAAESLNPQADDFACGRFEEETGLHLPEGLVTLYHWHDGQSRRCPTGIFYGMRFMSLQEVLVEWHFWAEEAESEMPVAPAPTDIVKQQPANRYWIPFAEDGDGNFLAIDLDPGPAGHAGQVINFGSDEDHHYVLAGNVAELISWMMRELQAGNHRIVDEHGGYSFSILRPNSVHFLDAAKTLFGTRKSRKAAPRN